MITIFGSEGSMGKRYKAILKYLGRKFECVDPSIDKVNCAHLTSDLVKYSDGIIVATPTDTHARVLTNLVGYGCQVPVLCEKPVSKDPYELVEIINLGLNITTMMQYKFLDSPSSNGETYYNYFRHGNDGLAWDCFQIIALARGKITIKEDSPIWKCELNGKHLSLADMDGAYLSFVENWLKNPGQNIEEIINHHKKVREWATQQISQ